MPAAARRWKAAQTAGPARLLLARAERAVLQPKLQKTQGKQPEQAPKQLVRALWKWQQSAAQSSWAAVVPHMAATQTLVRENKHCYGQVPTLVKARGADQHLSWAAIWRGAPRLANQLELAT